MDLFLIHSHNSPQDLVKKFVHNKSIFNFKVYKKFLHYCYLFKKENHFICEEVKIKIQGACYSATCYINNEVEIIRYARKLFLL